MFVIGVVVFAALLVGALSGPAIRRYAVEVVTEIKTEYASDIARVTKERDDFEQALTNFKANKESIIAEAEAAIQAEASKLIAAAEAEASAAKAELVKLQSALEVMVGLQQAAAPDPVATPAPVIPVAAADADAPVSVQAEPPQAANA